MVVLSVLSFLSIFVFYFNWESPLGNFVPIDGRPIRNFVFFGIDENFIKYNSYRNAGLWWEPGAFQTYLSLALILGTVLELIGIFQFGVLVLTILSTKSTTGIIILIISSFLYFSKIDFKFSRFFKISSVGILLSFLLLNPEVFEKFIPGSSSYDSFLARLSDFNVSLWLMKFFPLWGYGFGNLDSLRVMHELYAFEVQKMFIPSGTDGLTMLLSQVGVLGVYLLMVLLNPKFNKSYSLLIKIFYAISVLCIFNTQNFINFPIFIILLFYSFDSTALLKFCKIKSVE